MKFASNFHIIIILIFLPIIIDGFVIKVKNVRNIISGPLMIQVTCVHSPTHKEQIFMNFMAENQGLNVPSDATRKCATKSYEFTISDLTLQNQHKFPCTHQIPDNCVCVIDVGTSQIEIIEYSSAFLQQRRLFGAGIVIREPTIAQRQQQPRAGGAFAISGWQKGEGSSSVQRRISSSFSSRHLHPRHHPYVNVNPPQVLATRGTPSVSTSSFSRQPQAFGASSSRLPQNLDPIAFLPHPHTLRPLPYSQNPQHILHHHPRHHPYANVNPPQVLAVRGNPHPSSSSRQPQTFGASSSRLPQNLDQIAFLPHPHTLRPLPFSQNPQHILESSSLRLPQNLGASTSRRFENLNLGQSPPVIRPHTGAERQQPNVDLNARRTASGHSIDMNNSASGENTEVVPLHPTPINPHNDRSANMGLDLNIPAASSGGSSHQEDNGRGKQRAASVNSRGSSSSSDSG